ncbi:MAG: MinD/ParA family protein [Candidatus Hydrogenedentes bacterium]|nr:MinD/ParA family protein [Candidatus Hydrogenedentota bacterium]
MDQAHNLREFVRKQRSMARVLAVTSGKGGVGKTTASVNLAIALAKQGKRVIVLDADLGLANVEVLMGLNSYYNLQHVIDGEKRMRDILVKGPAGIEIAPGTSGLAKLADLNARARQNVLDRLQDLQEMADFVIIDTMAGIGQNAVRFAAAADEVLLVTTPEPSAIVDAYATIKTIVGIREDATFRLIVNMAASPQQALAVMTNLTRVARQYLGLTLSYLGHIVRDPHVTQSVMQSNPFTVAFPTSPAAKCVFDLADKIVRQRAESEHNRTGFFRRFAQTLGLASNG